MVMVIARCSHIHHNHQKPQKRRNMFIFLLFLQGTESKKLGGGRDGDGKLQRAVFAKPDTIALASVALAKDCNTD